MSRGIPGDSHENTITFNGTCVICRRSMFIARHETRVDANGFGTCNECAPPPEPAAGPWVRVEPAELVSGQAYLLLDEIGGIWAAKWDANYENFDRFVGEWPITHVAVVTPPRSAR